MSVEETKYHASVPEATRSLSASEYMWLRNGLRKPEDEAVPTRCMAGPGPRRFDGRCTLTARRATDVDIERAYK